MSRPEYEPPDCHEIGHGDAFRNLYTGWTYVVFDHLIMMLSPEGDRLVRAHQDDRGMLTILRKDRWVLVENEATVLIGVLYS